MSILQKPKQVNNNDLLNAQCSGGLINAGRVKIQGKLAKMSTIFIWRGVGDIR
ncbi:MAG: hypothetical protein RMY28_037865 [Nostoc sp. ChiSLP01]